jgi:hypothetical protein
LSCDIYDQVNSIESAKELWERIIVLHERTTLIQRSTYELSKSEINMLVVKDGESLNSRDIIGSDFASNHILNLFLMDSDWSE